MAWLALCTALCVALSGCPDDGEGSSGAGEGGSGGAASDAGSGGVGGTGGTTDPEAAAGLQLVAVYAGTWTVSGAGHSRGTVVISADGSHFDFDADKQFEIAAADVYNRIPQFIDSEPRVQIEIPGTPQQRLRIFVDPNDTSAPTSFAYYPSAETDDNAIVAIVQ